MSEIKDSKNKLACYAIIGSLFEGTNFDNNFKNTFRAEYDRLSKNGTEPLEAFRLANAKAAKEALKELPVIMRLNFMLNTFCSENSTATDEIINWKDINENITVNISEYDYQFIREVNSLEELKQLRLDIELAMSDLQPWKTVKCKDCDSEFSMNFGEVYYFLSKDMKLPKRCPACRKSRKGGNNAMKDNNSKKQLTEMVQRDLKKTEKDIDKILEESFKERKEYKTSIMADAFKRAGL